LQAYVQMARIISMEFEDAVNSSKERLLNTDPAALEFI